ncbi:uncharacterized protein T551_02989 [Pneumocystis jirovecii RU7]|uniref:Endoplasmic reticulum transmembrane protein n=1 Tax=Pneumocystis jirovecii (strain RU7) TaxID=1408657 RepID=A0A0W4ZGJ1_PNEJ7|nr:uncharacterized protein T551_02989 [Pneumocystis jirovecii RU7]KTW27490.1 hypothetical protein T551_02989 [Pneumocystis jirovecii RU7]
MTLYYSLVFSLLVIQMALFCLLVMPLPKRLRRRMFSFISTSTIIAKIRYGSKVCLKLLNIRNLRLADVLIKITFIFILVLFFDSVNRVFRAADDAKPGAGGALRDVYRSDIQARKFYSQRNMYLCGFTLFLSLIIDRVYGLTLQVFKYEDMVNAMKEMRNDETRSKALIDEITELKQRIIDKDREYSELSERYSKETRTGEDKKNM